jgi:protein-tyrosine phosphatase
MFFFNRKRSEHSDFSAIGVDMHSHLIPGVDDGAQNVADSVKLIMSLKDLGFSHLYTTPHTLLDYHPNTKETLEKGKSQLIGKLPEGISFNLSSEYYLDEGFREQLDANKLMPMPGNRLLIEFSQISRPPELESIIFEIGIKGYQPILAHPERYLFFHNDFAYFQRLKDMGVELQVNALSLTNHYGKSIRKTAEKLIENDMIDFIGTDTHHLRHIEVLKSVPTTKHYDRLVKSGLLKNKSLI